MADVLGIVICHNVHDYCKLEWIKIRGTLFKIIILFMMHCDFGKGTLNINIFITLFLGNGGGHKKRAVCTFFLTMWTILDDPLAVNVITRTIMYVN